MIKKRLHQIYVLIKDTVAFIKIKYFQKEKLGNKVLYVAVKNPNLYHRFFYLFLKFYQLSGYSIIYPMDFKKFRNLRNGDYYLSLILKEQHFLHLKNLKKENNFIIIEDQNLSPNYFEDFFKYQNQQKKGYHIPMSFHPLMYHKALWNQDILPQKERINSIFCYGNFDDKAYTEIDKTEFNIINRVKLYQFFKTKNGFHLLKNQEDLTQILQKKPEKNFIFAEKKHFPIPMANVRENLSFFRYFLCCPGVVMPLCHNIIEAMSVGTVPILQKEYAEVMYPNLEHKKNALIFDDLPTLEKFLETECFNISEKDFAEISKNAHAYYNQFLTPNKVTEDINQHLNQGHIFLNAEHRSVKIVK